MRIEQALPVPYAGSLSLRAKAEQLLLALASRAVSAGYNAFLGQVNRAYENITTTRDGSAAAEALLRSMGVRQWLINLQHLAQRSSRPSELPGLPGDSGSRLELLRECAVSFNLWEPPQSGAMPSALVLLFEKGATRNFHQAFEDSRIAASIRDAYCAHWALCLHLIALGQVVEGKLPTSATEPISEALHLSLRKALGLALGLPGNDELRESTEYDDVDILDLDEEQAAWSKYLRSTVRL